jgi:hypothetical protein
MAQAGSCWRFFLPNVHSHVFLLICRRHIWQQPPLRRSRSRCMHLLTCLQKRVRSAAAGPRSHRGSEIPTHPSQEEAYPQVHQPGLLQPPVEAVLGQVLDIGAVQQGPLNVCSTEKPAHVGMPESLIGRVQIERSVSVQMVVPANEDNRL